MKKNKPLYFEYLKFFYAKLRRFSRFFFLFISIIIAIYFHSGLNIQEQLNIISTIITRPVVEIFSIGSQSIVKQYKNLSNHISASRKVTELSLQVTELDEVMQENEFLHSEIKKYKSELKFREDNRITSKTFDLIINNYNSHYHSYIVKGGSEDAVELGDSVAIRGIMLGRIIKIYENFAEVQSIIDPSSNIPVVSEISNAKFIVGGSGGTNLKIKFLNPEISLIDGEKIYTSNDGGFFPKGLLVGQIHKQSGKPTIKARFLSESGNLVNVLKK